MSHWEESDEYRRDLEQLDREREISRRNGFKIDSALDVAEQVKIEVRHAVPGWAGWDASMALSQLVYEWMKDRNPHSLDLASVYCFQNSIPSTPTLWRLMGELAQTRVNGEQPAGTPEKVLRDKARSNTLILMANLVFHGATDEEAASKAARNHADRYPGLKQYKASTLLKEYAARFRKTGVQDKLFAVWEEWQGEGDRQLWKKILSELNDADDEMRGNRR
jgi:hypothetical protein